VIVAIHQPNYIPYYGYFHKIRQCDVFVFLDNVKYTKNGFINRNRIKTPKNVSWLTVPVQGEGLINTEIREVKISNATDWQERHWNTLKFNYGKAKHFSEYQESFKEVYNKKWIYLADLNKFLVKEICSLLVIKGEFIDASGLNVSGNKTDLIINICDALGADTYLSGQGAKGYLEEDKFRLHGIDLRYQKFEHPIYKQLFGEFTPNLSIIDMMFNEGKFL